MSEKRPLELIIRHFDGDSTTTVATFAVILPAAGKSSRFRDAYYKKPFAPLENRAVWLHAAERFLQRDDVKQLILVISPEDQESFHSKFGANVAILGIEVVTGGAERTDSVLRAIERVKPDNDFVAIHDAARPCLAEEWIDRVFEAAQKTGAAILGNPITSTIKRVAADQTITETVSRDHLWEAQTPQVFRRQLLIDAYARRGGPPATDDAQMVERLGQPVTIVPGSPLNLKITTKEDLRLAAHALKALPKPKGLGALHPFENDDLWR
ncbi:MAG: 2-C-methyl-D-erythritol 4-phosphate cytidylyltransferase [Planctomycetota bacterium]